MLYHCIITDMVISSVYVLLFRRIQSLARRGLHRAAMEFSKLLLALDPDSDPCGALLCIDYHALKAEQHAYVLQLAEVCMTDRG